MNEKSKTVFYYIGGACFLLVAAIIIGAIIGAGCQRSQQANINRHATNTLTSAIPGTTASPEPTNLEKLIVINNEDAETISRLKALRIIDSQRLAEERARNQSLTIELQKARSIITVLTDGNKDAESIIAEIGKRLDSIESQAKILENYGDN